MFFMGSMRERITCRHPSSVGFGQCAFAVAPGNFFDRHNAAAATVDAPHGVQKEDEEPPQGNELKAPFGELVVAGRRQMAARADWGRTLARSDGHFDTRAQALRPIALAQSG